MVLSLSPQPRANASPWSGRVAVDLQWAKSCRGGKFFLRPDLSPLPVPLTYPLLLLFQNRVRTHYYALLFKASWGKGLRGICLPIPWGWKLPELSRLSNSQWYRPV